MPTFYAIVAAREPGRFVRLKLDATDAADAADQAGRSAPERTLFAVVADSDVAWFKAQRVTSVEVAPAAPPA